MLKRDFRFAPTRMPAAIHGHNFRTWPLQIHYEGHHNQDNGKGCQIAYIGLFFLWRVLQIGNAEPFADPAF